MDGDVSISLPEEPSIAFTSEQGGTSDPLDVAALADFEDEAALINDLLLSESRSADASSSFIDDVSGNHMPLPELDIKLARLLGTLEHACQDTSSQVERAIEEVSRTVPRLTFDLQVMRENVVLLRFTLENIRKRSIEATAQSETSQVLRRLKVLDTIKTRMEAARDVLREAEAWSTLESEVTALVQEQSYAKAAERLAEANKSMVVFQNSPEYEQRRSLMVSLQNGLEAGLSASLVTAINARDVNACKSYYAIFGQIQRETEFRNYYFGSRRSNLLNDWQNARLTDCPTVAAPETSVVTSRPASPIPPVAFSTYLPNFYARVQNTLNDERIQIPAIFPDPLDTLSSFLQSTIDGLVPSLPQRISDLSNSHGPQLLLELIKIYHSTEEFAIAADRIFARLSATLVPSTSISAAPSPSTPHRASISSEAGPPTPGMPPSNAVKRLRRQSKAMSISRRSSRGGLAAFSLAPPHANGIGSPNHRMSIAEASEPVPAWETSLFEPFLDWQAEYADLETRLLNSEIARLSSGQDATAFLLSSASIADDNGDDGNASGGRKNVAKHLLDQSSHVFTLAEEAMGRCMALTHGYGAAAYVEAVDMILKTFLHKERDTLSRAVDMRTRRRRSTVADSKSDGSIEYTQEDWATFQLALRLLDASRTIWNRISALETKVIARLVDVASLIKEARIDPLSQVVPGTSKGALVLLWQSTLNSASLNSLIDAIDQHHQHPNQSPPPNLFVKARTASIDLTRASQLFLHNTILTPLLQALEKYPVLPVWSQSSDTRADSRSAAFDLHIPTFSLSPSEIITHVGEGLFNLPGLFEVYAEDDALGFSLDTLPGLDAETVKHLRKEHGQTAGVGIGHAPLPSPQNVMNRHGHRMSIVGNEFLPSKLGEPLSGNSSHSNRVSPSLSHHSSYSMSSPSANNQSQDQQTEPLSTELVISTWLSSLTRSVLNHLVKEALPSIRYISKHGEAQLASDLAYISNVAKALDVELEELEGWKAALESTENGTKASEVDSEQPQIAPSNPEIEETIRRMRLKPLNPRAER